MTDDISEVANKPEAIDHRKIDTLPWLHVRGQFTYHGEAFISGTVIGLAALRDALSAAIDNRDGEAIVYASDGEGYAVTVLRCARNEDMGSPPYIDNLARSVADAELEWVRQQEKRNRNLWLERSNEIRALDYRIKQLTDELATALQSKGGEV